MIIKAMLAGGRGLGTGRFDVARYVKGERPDQEQPLSVLELKGVIGQVALLRVYVIATFITLQSV